MITLESEIRSDFYVSNKRKKIWKIQIDILQVIKDICIKYNLRYFASNGTLLGAVKYHGFVPWDDDMDIIMPRPDYEVFKKIVNNELKEPYYFQDGCQSKHYYRSYGRLRNKETTAVPIIDIDKSPINGIFVDIFPIDGINQKNNIFLNQLKKYRFYDRTLMQYVYKGRDENKIKSFIYQLFVNAYVNLRGYYKLAKSSQEIFNNCSFENCKKVFYYSHNKPIIIDIRDLSESVIYDFEGSTISVPNGYYNILRELYGDNYMNELPGESERRNHHTIFFDPDNSYLKYYKNVSKEFLIEHINDF